jgi:hypothetical protein
MAVGAKGLRSTASPLHWMSRIDADATSVTRPFGNNSVQMADMACPYVSLALMCADSPLN